MAWVHCNFCFITPDRQEGKFRFSSCGRIICKRCVPKLSVNACKFCKGSCRTMELNDQVPKEVTSMFSDPMKKLKEIFKACNFQETNKLGYINHLSRELAKRRQELKHIQREQALKESELNAALEKETALAQAEQELKERLNSVTMARAESAQGSCSGRSGSDAGGGGGRYQRLQSRVQSESGLSNILNCSAGSNGSRGSKPSHVRALFNGTSPSTEEDQRFLNMQTPQAWHNNKISRYRSSHVVDNNGCSPFDN